MVDRGVFVSPLTNHYNARLTGVVNTGHGTRLDGVSPTNLHVGLGSRTEAELIGEVDDGVYLEAGSLSPDPASGDFSAALDFAFKIDRGKLTYPLAGAMAAGNLNDLLMHTDATSSDYRVEPGQVLPAVRVSNVQFSGGG
jgi:TldD protein